MPLLATKEAASEVGEAVEITTYRLQVVTIRTATDKDTLSCSSSLEVAPWVEWEEVFMACMGELRMTNTDR
jgi:hypothetical protein